MDYIYQLTRELVSSSISQMEDKITQAEDDLYRMIVSDEIQRGGTMLLESRYMQEEGEETYRQARRRRALGMTAIVDELQKQVSANHAIVCANFLDSDNSVQVIAATGYYKLDEENAAQVGGAAIEAAGSTILLDGPKLTGNDHILVMAKQLRERKNLSLAHIGVVVLFVDMEKVGEVLTDTHDAVYVIRDTKNQVEYVLNRSGQELPEQAWTAAEENLQRQSGYSVITEKDSSWFAVTVASLTGIANVGKEYFEAARTLGANDRQLVFRVAIPHAMPSILQGCTQAMSSSCIVIMIAEMLGVKSGLGWYMTWQTGWASYDKSFAALFVICFIFTLVTKGLERIKRYLLRWQNGAEK